MLPVRPEVEGMGSTSAMFLPAAASASFFHHGLFWISTTLPQRHSLSNELLSAVPKAQAELIDL